MTSLTNILRQAQALLGESHSGTPDSVETSKAHFGETAWSEADRFHATGELPRSVEGLELVAIDIKLEEEV